MNANFKPLGLAAAVATATAGYAGVVNAQALAGNTQLGDLALVPYYTVVEGQSTGVNVINTSDRTQAVKIRFRRASDSMDALDFNVVLSPHDEYTGFIIADGEDVKFASNDNSCTVPDYTSSYAGIPAFAMPTGALSYRTGAETGYIEILSMGSPVDETYPVAISAKHVDGVPLDCAGVRDNFFAGGVAGTTRGVVNSVLTVQNTVSGPKNNDWMVSPDSLKASYFIKDDDTGIEFGNNAVHIVDFFDGASMTNQQRGVFSGDLQGFDHPDLNGGAPASNGVPGAATYGVYQKLRNILGATALINDWSRNVIPGVTVDTDWVITIPGQYVMLDLPRYLASLVANDPLLCLSNPLAPACDNRDIPMIASVNVYDREEAGKYIDPGDLVVSPQPPGQTLQNVLDKEVNVIQWGESPVLHAPSYITVNSEDLPPGAKFGWASVAPESDSAKYQAICEYVYPPTQDLAMDCHGTLSPAPIIGFVAWQRNFVDDSSRNYGRIVEHSRVQSAS